MEPDLNWLLKEPISTIPMTLMPINKKFFKENEAAIFVFFKSE